jgi:hypothetical protein
VTDEVGGVGGPIQVRVTPPASIPFQSSLMNQRTSGREDDTSGNGEGEGEEEYGVLPKKRYEEQSKREREERRKRLSYGPGMGGGQ